MFRWQRFELTWAAGMQAGAEAASDGRKSLTVLPQHKNILLIAHGWVI